MIQTLEIQGNAAQDLCRYRLSLDEYMNIRQKLQRLCKEVNAGWFLLLIILIHERLSKGHDQQEMDVEETATQDLRSRVCIELVELGHECFLVEEVEDLSAVKFD